MRQRHEFVLRFAEPGANRRALCRQYGISPTTGYDLAERYAGMGAAGLADRSRKPHRSPARTAPAMEAEVLALRGQHPVWGGRKLRRRLRDLGHSDAPSASTITAILHRHGCIEEAASAARRQPERFERAAPNELWQMDFKGHFPMARGQCHPLTVLDDHSRFALGLRACADQRETTVRDELMAIFRRYGLPERMLMDNGSPWGSSNAAHRYTGFELWLIELGVGVIHGRPYHPQTQGKDERFHRTLAAEAVGRRYFTDLAHCQRRFDEWRDTYNLERPHQALADATPVTRYRQSLRPFRETPVPFDYGPEMLLRRVDGTGRLALHGGRFKVGRALAGRQVGLRPMLPDGCFAVFFCGHQVAQVDLREPPP